MGKIDVVLQERSGPSPCMLLLNVRARLVRPYGSAGPSECVERRVGNDEFVGRQCMVVKFESISYGLQYSRKTPVVQSSVLLAGKVVDSKMVQCFPTYTSIHSSTPYRTLILHASLRSKPPEAYAPKTR
jgi:hypothetical protein